MGINWSLIRDGEDPVWLEINKVPLYNEKGEVVGTLSTAEDVTRKVNLEKQLFQFPENGSYRYSGRWYCSRFQ